MMRLVMGRAAFADGAVVELDGGDDLGGGAGEEKFVRRVDIVAGQLLHGDLSRSRRRSRDACQVMPRREPA